MAHSDTPWGWMMDSTRRFAAEAEAHTGGAALALAAALAAAVLVQLLARVCARGRREESALLDDAAEEQSVLLDDSKAPPESPRETPGQRPAPSSKTPALTPATASFLAGIEDVSGSVRRLMRSWSGAEDAPPSPAASAPGGSPDETPVRALSAEERTLSCELETPTPAKSSAPERSPAEPQPHSQPVSEARNTEPERSSKVGTEPAAHRPKQAARRRRLLPGCGIVRRSTQGVKVRN